MVLLQKCRLKQQQVIQKSDIWRFENMKKLYTNPEVEVIKFASVDNINSLNSAVTGTVGATGNIKTVNIGVLHK